MRHMTNFEGLKNLCIVLKMKHTLKKHWMDSIRWCIIESMNELLESIQNVIVVVNFIYVNNNKIIAIDNNFGFLCIYMLFKVGNKFHFWLV